MPGYKHTQVGTLILASLLPVLIFFCVLLYLTRFHPITLAVFSMLLLALLLFGALTVELKRDEIELVFGLGLIRKRFSLLEIRRVRPVRNPWYYGWGIRWYPRGWLFNVSGLDAVELEMTDGRHYRIGTDEPQALLEAIERSRAHAILRRGEQGGR